MRTKKLDVIVMSFTRYNEVKIIHMMVFTFGQGNTDSYRRQRRTSCGFPCEGFLVLANDIDKTVEVIQSQLKIIKHGSNQQTNSTLTVLSFSMILNHMLRSICQSYHQ